MMILSVASLLLAAQSPAPRVPTPAPAGAVARLIGASMFKNGFAVTQRIVDVPRPGTTTVVPVPQGAMGTLWFTPSDGMTLDSVVVENEATSAVSQPVGSIDSILSLNVGRTATLVILQGTAQSRLTARIVSASGLIVVIQTPDGVTRVLNKSSVIGVEGKGLRSDSPVPMGSRRVMRLRTLGKPGKIAIVALERGLSWTPAYAVNLLPGGKELSLVAKATVTNDLERLTDLDCRFVTGFPNLPFAETLDPLVAYAMATPNAFPGGGFGGAGGGFAGQMAGRFENSRAAKVGYAEGDMALAANGQAPDGEYQGELFFYHRPNVSVDIGGRAAYTLFRTTATYETIYAWDLGDPAPGQSQFVPRIPAPGMPSTEEVWQTLRFQNSAKLPLTTGPATTFSAGEIVGQDTLKYASPGQTAELRVTRSLDISPDSIEEETGRERGFVKYDNTNFRYDRVTVRGTLTLVNRKSTAVRVRIRKSFTGEWLSGDGNPTVTTTAAGLRQPNPTGLAEWTATVEPGATLKLIYSTRLLVNS